MTVDKRKKREGQRASQVLETTSKNEDVVTYHSFFQSCLTRGTLKSWQEPEVQAFFKSLGLTDKEPTYRYRDALLKY